MQQKSKPDEVRNELVSGSRFTSFFSHIMALGHIDAVGELIFQAQRKTAFVRKQEQTFGNAPTASIRGLPLPVVLSLRPVSSSVPALSNVVLLLSAGLSASDAMENEANLWEI